MKSKKGTHHLSAHEVLKQLNKNLEDLLKMVDSRADEGISTDGHAIRHHDSTWIEVEINEASVEHGKIYFTRRDLQLMQQAFDEEGE